MTAIDNESFEQKGDDVATAAGRLGALADELDVANASADREPEEVGSWIRSIGKALIAIFGIGHAGGT